MVEIFCGMHPCMTKFLVYGFNMIQSLKNLSVSSNSRSFDIQWCNLTETSTNYFRFFIVIKGKSKYIKMIENCTIGIFENSDSFGALIFINVIHLWMWKRTKWILCILKKVKMSDKQQTRFVLYLMKKI